MWYIIEDVMRKKKQKTTPVCEANIQVTECAYKKDLNYLGN
jgi:hypothetical protein